MRIQPPEVVAGLLFTTNDPGNVGVKWPVLRLSSIRIDPAQEFGT